MNSTLFVNKYKMIIIHVMMKLHCGTLGIPYPTSFLIIEDNIIKRNSIFSYSFMWIQIKKSLVEEVHGNHMFSAHVNNYFGGNKDSGVGCKKLTVFLLFYVYDQWFVDIYWLIEEDFVVIDHGVGYESVLDKDVENNVLEGALVVFFVEVPEFGKVLVWDGIGELISKDVLHGDGGVKSLFCICVCVFQLSSTGSSVFIGDDQVWYRIGGDDEVIAIACKEDIIFHCDAKMAFLSITVRAWDGQGILVCMLLNDMHASVDHLTGAWC